MVKIVNFIICIFYQKFLNGGKVIVNYYMIVVIIYSSIVLTTHHSSNPFMHINSLNSHNYPVYYHHVQFTYEKN